MSPTYPSAHRPIVSLLGLAVLTGGCDAQADPTYRGESLLSIRGKVNISADSDQDLVPALVFTSSEYTYFLETEVEGEFPSSFQLAVFEPPPEEAFLKAPFEGLPDAALALIVAAKADHPKEAVVAVTGGGAAFSRGGSCAAGTQEPFGSGSDGDSREPQEDSCFSETIEEQCFGDGSCVTTTITCRGESEVCETVVEGEVPEGYEPTEPYLAGAAQDYFVLYLREAVEEGSGAAEWLGGAYPAGYSVIRHREATAEEQAAAEQCHAAAADEAAELLNDQLGTLFEGKHMLEGIEPCSTFFEDECPPDPTGGVDWETIDETWEQLFNDALFEQRCPFDVDDVIERIDDPSQVSISVQVRGEGEPLFGDGSDAGDSSVAANGSSEDMGGGSGGAGGGSAVPADAQTDAAQ